VVLVVLVTLAPAVLLTQQVLRVPAVLIRRVALAALRTLVQDRVGLIRRAVSVVPAVLIRRVALVDRQISGQVARVAPAVLILRT
jgi:hypothetical protein